MYSYICGKVTDIKTNCIVIDNNNIGYLIYTANPYSFVIGESYTVYLYQHIREDDMSLYGFKTSEEKDLFLKLIEVKGLGPKMTLPMLATGSVNGIIDAIERENILYLRKFPKIGEKIAKQIILDLKGKLVSNKEDIIIEDTDELSGVLKGFGYKQGDILKVIAKVNHANSLEEQIKEALKLFLK